MLRRQILANGISLELLESDPKARPTVLFCHGNSSSAASFQRLVATTALGEWRRVAISLPGHGASEFVPATEGYTFAGLSSVVVDVCRNLGNGQPLVLCGHSLGGHLFSQVLSRIPEAKGAFLMSAPPIHAGRLDLVFKPDPTGGCLFKRELSEADVRRMTSLLAMPGKVSPSDLAELERAVRRTDREFRPALGAEIAAGKVPDEVSEILRSKVPVALVGGQSDPFLQDDAYAQIPTSRIWGKCVHRVTGAGHSPHLEAPQLVESLLKDFVQEIRSDGGTVL